MTAGRRRWRSWLVLLAASVAAAGTARLGFWQLDRAAQKLALARTIEQRGALPPLPQSALARTADEVAEQLQRRVRVSGEWLPQHTVFLDNRQMDGRPGFFVLTPLRLQPAPPGFADAGAPVLWVQRGWVARDNDDRSRLPAVPTPPGRVEVEGRIAPPPARLFQFAADRDGVIRQNLDLDASARSLGRPVLPLTVLQTEPPTGVDDGLRRRWPPPAVDVHKHHGYAFQWFALSALIAGLYIWFQIVRRWRRPRDEQT